MKLNMIVCVAGTDNLIGDKEPVAGGNGLLWHSKEDLLYFKKKTLGNVVVFGKNTAKFVPLELMRQNREVFILNSKSDIELLFQKYENTDKEIFICGGAIIYEYFLENYTLDTIYLSRLKNHVKVNTPRVPLFFKNPEIFQYKISETTEFNDFMAYIYKK